MEKTNTQEPNLEIRYTSNNAVTNPYSVTNMQAAWVKLKAKFQDSVGLNINGLVDVRTTHNYIRFEASTAADVEKISNDTINEIYSYPLDVDLSDLEIADFRDDTLVPGNSLYRYASIKVGNPIPDVTYTILAALYIPEEDNLLTNTGSSLTTYSKREI